MKLSDFKTPLILIIIGAGLVVIGALFKITHWEFSFLNANLFIALGGILEFIAAVLTIIKLLKMRS